MREIVFKNVLVASTLKPVFGHLAYICVDIQHNQQEKRPRALKSKKEIVS
jgi:hypothetical protein